MQDQFDEELWLITTWEICVIVSMIRGVEFKHIRLAILEKTLDYSN